MIEVKTNGEVYTEKEFQKDLIRMFDSIRVDKTAKGTYSCIGVLCKECPIHDVACKSSSPYKAYETIKTVQDWAKKHPVYTNRDKLKEVFGEDVLHMFLKSNYRYGDDIKRFEFDTEFEKWLNAEYKES